MRDSRVNIHAATDSITTINILTLKEILSIKYHMCPKDLKVAKLNATP